MNEADRAECERVWELANDAFFKQQEKTGDGHGAAIPLLLAAKRKWENAKLDEAAEAIHYWDTALGDASSAIERLKQE